MFSRSASATPPLGHQLQAMKMFVSAVEVPAEHHRNLHLRYNDITSIWEAMQNTTIPALKPHAIPTPLPRDSREEPEFFKSVATIARGIFDPRIKELASSELTQKTMRKEALEPNVLEWAIEKQFVSKSPTDKLLHSARVFSATTTKRISGIGVIVTDLVWGASAVHVISKAKSWEFWHDLGGLDIGVFFLGLISFITFLGLEGIRWSASRELAGYANNTSN